MLKKKQQEWNKMWQNCMYPIQLIGFCSHVSSDTETGKLTHAAAKRVIFDDVLSFWGSQPGETNRKQREKKLPQLNIVRTCNKSMHFCL